MRELTGHKVNDLNKELTIQVQDEPGQGGANHLYCVSYPGTPITSDDHPQPVSLFVRFQNGPIKEAGINGVTQEALLEIVADRLRSFQAGPFSTKENAVALTHVETAQLWLHKRTLDRISRGVEGINQK